MDTNWPDNVNIGLQYADLRQGTLHILAKSQSTWDRRLGRFGMAIHHVRLTSQDLRPGNAFPYDAGPKEREFKETELYKSLCMNAKEPAQLKSASPIVIGPMKDRSIHFWIGLQKDERRDL